MNLALFQFTDDILAIYRNKKESYQAALVQIENFFSSLELGEGVVSLPSRLKKEKSLKEKVIRQELFTKYKNAKVAFDNISDLIGITIQVRFIHQEVAVFENLFHSFQEIDDKIYRANQNHKFYLNLKDPQPQFQNNGCPIYRIDGYYQTENTKFRFELQIKAMVHQFWSDIEHEVIYKNSDYVLYDRFNRNMLAAIRENLEIMDHQLELIYEEISPKNTLHQIGFDEIHFKVFMASKLNEVIKMNMEKNLGFSTDFQKASSTIAQLIYLKELTKVKYRDFSMLDYLQRIDELKHREIDFKKAFILAKPTTLSDAFLAKIVPYLYQQANNNFQWHVFFRMIFEIQNEESIDTFIKSISMIEHLLIQEQWLLNQLGKYDGDLVDGYNYVCSSLAKAIIIIGDLKVFYEENLLKINHIFHELIEKMILEKYDLQWFDKELLRKVTHNI